MSLMKPEGRKDDTGKPRWRLLRQGCALGLLAVIRVLMYGAKKYGDNNWQDVANADERYRDALDRHLSDLDRGIQYDADTGEHNYAHVATNALFLLELALRAESMPPSTRPEPADAPPVLLYEGYTLDQLRKLPLEQRVSMMRHLGFDVRSGNAVYADARSVYAALALQEVPGKGLGTPLARSLLQMIEDFIRQADGWPAPSTSTCAVPWGAK